MRDLAGWQHGGRERQCPDVDAADDLLHAFLCGGQDDFPFCCEWERNEQRLANARHLDGAVGARPESSAAVAPSLAPPAFDQRTAASWRGRAWISSVKTAAWLERLALARRALA